MREKERKCETCRERQFEERERPRKNEEEERKSKTEMTCWRKREKNERGRHSK